MGSRSPENAGAPSDNPGIEVPQLGQPAPKVKRTNSRRQDRWEVVQDANTPEMTKKKMKICPIGSWRGRRATFMKRKIGLLKKARELSVLCGNTVSIVMTDLHGQLVSFESAEGDLERLYQMLSSSGSSEKFTNMTPALSGEAAQYSDSEEGSVHSVESNEGWRSSQNNSPENTPTAAAAEAAGAFQSLGFPGAQGGMVAPAYGGSWRQQQQQQQHGGSSGNLNPGHHHHHPHPYGLENPRAASAPGPETVHIPGNLPVWQHSPHQLPPQPPQPDAPAARAPGNYSVTFAQNQMHAAMSKVNNLSISNAPPQSGGGMELGEVDPVLQQLLMNSGGAPTPPVSAPNSSSLDGFKFKWEEPRSGRLGEEGGGDAMWQLPKREWLAEAGADGGEAYTNVPEQPLSSGLGGGLDLGLKRESLGDAFL